MVATSLWVTTLAVLSSLLPGAVLAQNCHCYLTNGTTPKYFVNHKFFDFRNIANPRVPPVINSFSGAANAGVTHPYFNTTAFTNTWALQSWASNGTVANTYSKNDVYIQQNTDSKANSKTFMTLRTYRHPASNGNFQESAEFDTVSPNYRYVSMRMYARVQAAKGGVAAMFTYRGGATAADVQEADVEILTREATNEINYTNQPSQVGGVARPNATAEVAIPGVWSNWRVHRYDWTPGASNWYVDGKLVNSNKFQAPVDPATLIFNTWSDGGSWSGLMAAGQQALMQVQWIQLIYNNTDFPSKYAHCANVCSLDRGNTIGTPVVISSGP
ncbi:glycoside hydrolase family 16 protein [Hypoxylon fuscum]|nr:glycoside hydrolase family 16 protein [Hypoxylon fuscum]